MSAEPSIQLREVPGPSALGGGRHRFFELLWLISTTEFKKTYFGTVLGYLWSLIRPLALFGVLLVVFTKVIRLGSHVENYPVMLLFNLVVFGFFQEATGAAVNSVLAQEGIVRKTQFPRLVIPLAVVLNALFTLGLNLIAVFAFILIYGVDPTWTWLLLPVVLAPLLLLTGAIALLLSVANVRFRDVSIIWTVAATVLMYGTPIIYTIEFVPSNLKALFLANPLTPIFIQAREWIIAPNEAPNVVAAAGGIVHLIPSMVLFVGICVFGIWAFFREAPRVAEAL